MHTAATGMEAQALNIDTIAHNLANINTTGFKARRAEFHDLIYQNMRQAGVSSTATTEIPVSLQIGLGTRPVATAMNLKQGDFVQTQNPLNMVIRGQGFFQISMPDGDIAYTRNGNFHLNNEGSIVTSEGDLLDPQITIPEDQTGIYVGADGVVSVTTPGSTTPQQVGQIQIVTFQNPGGLESIGDNLMKQTQASGEPIVGTPGENGLGSLLSGFVEQSNVSVVEEMVAMIVSQRAYEANSKVIRTADEMFQTGTAIVR
jgi:flagellar basal-body rod protein FlgG